MKLPALPVLTAAQLALLEATGAHARPHSGRTLLAHLVGTYALLRAWQAPERVCLAALFHSIYGTNAFKHHSLGLDQRATLTACIGHEAEQLAYLFCSVDRPKALIDAVEGEPVLHRLTAASVAIPRPTLCDLLCIECANLIEQGGRSQSLNDIFCLAVVDRSLLPPQVYAALKAHLATPAAQRLAKAEAMA
jgi:hypothetical protein